MEIKWIDGFNIRVNIINGAVVISANKEGLFSLADQLTALAEEPPGSHIHYDEHNSLEEDSVEMIIEISNPDRPHTIEMGDGTQNLR